MKTCNFFVAALITVSGQAFAQTITLNPGDANVFGQPLTCTLSQLTPPTPPSPPTPPPMVLVPIGQNHSRPDMACINNVNAANNGALGKAAENCKPEVTGPTACDQTEVIQSSVDQNCYSTVAKKAHGALDQGQEDAIQKACTVSTSTCLVYQPAQ